MPRTGQEAETIIPARLIYPNKYSVVIIPFSSIIGLFVALLVTVLLIMSLKPIASAMGLVDIPNERSSHTKSTPLVGGLAIYIAVATAYSIPAVMSLVPINREIGSFFIAGLAVVSIGVIDDYRPLPSWSRFLVQVIASLIMIFGARVVLTDLGGMMPSGEVIYLGWMSIPFTIFATLGVINALNMSDGLDGLSGTMALISISGLLLAAISGNAAIPAYLLMLLAASIVGFLIFNLRLPGRDHAVVFMGDAGSMFLGLTLTWFAIRLSQGSDRIITPASALWFLMLPIFDTVAMIIRRVLRRRSPFSPDKEHIHHIFLMAGFSVNETVIIMTAAAMIGTGIGLLSLNVHAPEFSVSGLFLVAGLLYMWMIMRSWKMLRFIERSICRRRGDRRSGEDRRITDIATYNGQERRSGEDRRKRNRRVTVDGVAPVETDIPFTRDDSAIKN